MFKRSITICILFVTIIACKKENNKEISKNTDSTTSELVADNGKIDKNIDYNVDVSGKKTVKTDYVYKATDGTLVKVKFSYEHEKGNVTITNNNKTFVLDKKMSDGSETTYEKADMKATVKNDSLIIHQGQNIIELVKTKI